MGRAPVSNFDIFLNTVMEQHGILLDKALRCAQRRCVDALDVFAGNLHPAQIGIPEPHEQFEQRGFAAAAAAGDAHDLVLRDVQRDFL